MHIKGYIVYLLYVHLAIKYIVYIFLGLYVCVYLSISIDQQLRKGGYEFEREQGCGDLRESKGVDTGAMRGRKGKGQNIIIF